MLKYWSLEQDPTQKFKSLFYILFFEWNENDKVVQLRRLRAFNIQTPTQSPFQVIVVCEQNSAENTHPMFLLTSCVQKFKKESPE